MKKLFLGFIVVFLTFTLFHSCNEPLINDQTGDELELKSADLAKKSYIVVLNDEELNSELSKLKGYEKKQDMMKTASAKILKRAGILDGEIEFVYGTALKGFSVKIAPGQLKKLQNDPSVKYIEEDQIVSLIEPKVKPTVKPTKPAPEPEPQVIPLGIARVGGPGDGVGKTAWVIDTGIDLDHPDLNVDEDRSAYFVPRVYSADDDNGHGTHCAGIIAAINDDFGVVGVAAGATVVPVKVLNKRGSGTTTGVIAGVDYVAENAADGDVANMSLGGGISTALDTAVLNASYNADENKNIYFALAAGNERDDADNHSPARVNGDNIYTISAMDSSDEWAYFSNYGDAVDYCEPGVSIYSTYKNGGYATLSGTSMAAPHMCGILLMTNGNPETDGYVSGDPDGDPDPIGAQ